MLYELRTYWANPGKEESMHRRFAVHTDHLFRKHGMTVVAYWIPEGGRELHGDLVYLLAHVSQTTYDESWAGFRNDPEVDGVLVEKLDSVLLRSTVYSPLK